MNDKKENHKDQKGKVKDEIEKAKNKDRIQIKN